MHSQIVVNPGFHGGPKLARGTSFGSQNQSGGPILMGDRFFRYRLTWLAHYLPFSLCSEDFPDPL